MFLLQNYDGLESTEINDMYQNKVCYSIQLNGMSSCHRNASINLNRSFFIVITNLKLKNPCGYYYRYVSGLHRS